MVRYSRKINDSLVLLSYLSANHPENQSIRSLARAVGTSKNTLQRILVEAYNRRETQDSILHRTAEKYDFEFALFNGWVDLVGNPHGKTKLIVDAVKTLDRVPLVEYDFCPDCNKKLPSFLEKAECTDCGWNSADLKIGKRRFSNFNGKKEQSAEIPEYKYITKTIPGPYRNPLFRDKIGPLNRKRISLEKEEGRFYCPWCCYKFKEDELNLEHKRIRCPDCNEDVKKEYLEFNVPLISIGELSGSYSEGMPIGQ
jgi:Zn finger protein HypA/HybF involved in hydrogenase expression